MFDFDKSGFVGVFPGSMLSLVMDCWGRDSLDLEFSWECVCSQRRPVIAGTPRIPSPDQEADQDK